MSSAARRTVIRRRGLSVLASVALLSSLFVLSDLGTASAACGKAYSSTIPANSVDLNAGTFTLSFTNQSSTCTSAGIGSITILVPTGVTVTNVSLPSGWAWDTTSPTATADPHNVYIYATSGTSKIAYQGTLNVGITASGTLPCSTWDSTVYVATTWTSSTFARLAGTSAPAVPSPDGICALVFKSQPANAAKNDAISDTAYTPEPGGGPVVVEAQDGSGNVVSTFTGTIVISVDTSTASGYTLSGTLSEPAVAGDASFSDLSLDVVGRYTLKASFGSLSATSNQFTIVGDACKTGGICTDSFNDQNGNDILDGSIQNNGGNILVLSLNLDTAPDCTFGGTVTDPFKHAPTPWTIDSIGKDTTTGTKTLNIRIDKSYRFSIGPDQGASSWRPCVTALEQFKTYSGTLATLTGTNPNEYTGLLPDCSKKVVVWCTSVKATGVGDILESITVPYSGKDPKGR